MIVAGPCLINNVQSEIDNARQTAMDLAAIDPSILFRAKVWGGGLNPEIYFPGIGQPGLNLLEDIRQESGLKVGVEIQNDSRLLLAASKMNFIWIAARAMQSYGLLEAIGRSAVAFSPIIIKRHFGTRQEEAWGVHDICHKIHGFKPILCERGVNVADQIGWDKWIPDFRFMAYTLRERPDIDLMFDPSHTSGNRKNILPYVKAAVAMGIKHFMLEVYSDPACTQSDCDQAIGIEEFKRIHEIITEGKHE